MSSVEEDILRRHFVTIATGDYDAPHCAPLPVAGEVKALRQWLCDHNLGSRGFQPCHPELATNPSKQQIRDALEDPPVNERWRDSDAAVVFVTGHGKTINDAHYLILQKTDTSRPNATAVKSADLIGWLAETRIEHLLLILDACYAGKVATDALRLDREPPDTWLVLPSATKNQEAVTGALTAAITAFLTELASREGQKYGLDPYLTVDDFLDGVQEKLGDGQTLQPLYGSRRRRPHPCLPNPHYRPDDAVAVAAARHDLALDRQDLLTHWGPRSRGVASHDQPGWLFTGRATLMQALIDAATGAPGATVITGGAGSGKSAVLARLVTLSDPQFCDEHADDVAAIPPDLRPDPSAVDAAIVATGKLHTQVLAQLCHALHVPAPISTQPEPTVEERLAAWHRWLIDQPEPVTIVIDALDEATHPATVMTEVLARLEPEPAQPRIRLLIGVRSLAARDDPTHQPTSPAVGLADTAETTLRARRIVVDEAPWWHQQDVIDYVDSILRHTPGSPYATAPEELGAAVAVSLGTRAGRSFLIARIAASSLAAGDTVITADDPGWLAALDQGVLGVFRQDLHHSLSDADDRRRAVILLRAVAFAYGPGLPWRGIWPLVAHAVDDNGSHYGDSDIAWLLNSRLGAYLITDREDDTTVYRLFHDLLRSTLRERWRDLLQPLGS
jgi:hypothetical protein